MDTQVAAAPVSTKAEREMADQLTDLEPGSKRYEALHCAVTFKRSWFQLARHLAEIDRDGLYAKWGFRSLEAYALSELHLRRDTVSKLVRSFRFLASHEKSLLHDVQENPKVVPLPNYRALDILAEARENTYLPEEEYREIRDRVFAEDPPPSRVRQLVREHAPPAEEEEDDTAGLRRCLKLAERLYGMLVQEEAPAQINKSVESAIGSLRRALGEG